MQPDIPAFVGQELHVKTVMRLTANSVANMHMLLALTNEHGGKVTSSFVDNKYVLTFDMDLKDTTLEIVKPNGDSQSVTGHLTFDMELL